MGRLRVHGLGNLTADAEYKEIKGNENGVLSFAVAMNSKVKGEKHTDFYNCEMWVRPDHGLIGLLTKGRQVMVDGEMQVDRVGEGADTKRYHKIKLNSYNGVTLTGRRDDNEEPAAVGAGAAASASPNDDVPF